MYKDELSTMLKYAEKKEEAVGLAPEELQITNKYNR